MAKMKKETPKKAAAAKTGKTAPAKATAKASAKPMAKSTKKAEPKVKLAVVERKKGDKKSEKLELKAVAVEVQTSEEDEEEMEMASSGGGASQAGLAMAAATAGADTAAGSLKNFRHHPDIENYYRFIYENDLRYEALEIIDAMALERANRKAVKTAKARPN
jgi:hypothetical protein